MHGCTGREYTTLSRVTNSSNTNGERTGGVKASLKQREGGGSPQAVISTAPSVEVSTSPSPKHIADMDFYSQLLYKGGPSNPSLELPKNS